MRPRASIALSMTVLLSTASFVSAATFASAAEASETSDYDGSSTVAPLLALLRYGCSSATFSCS
jgi:ABC-type phosphate transport system substrate-binding protein